MTDRPIVTDGGTDSLDPTPLEQEGITFSRRVNGVDDLGMDPTGQSLNDGEFRRALSQNGTLLELPPGTYKVGANSSGHSPRVSVNSNRVGVIGLGQNRDDVRIVTQKGRYSRWLQWSGRDFLFKNLVWDQYDDFDTLLGHHMAPGGGRLAVVGCGIVGSETTQGAVPNSGSRDPMFMAISNNGGHLRIKNWVDLSPTRFDDYPQNRSIFWTGMGATGSAHISDLWVRHGSGSIFYFGKDRMSPITFEDCHFEHCHDKCIRATGRNTVIKNSTFWWDDRKWHPATHVTGGRRAPRRASARAIWAQTNSRSQRAGPTIENCHVKVDHTRWGGGEIAWNQYAGAGTVKNCRFERNTGGAAIIAGSGSGSVHVHNCHFTGSSGRPTAGSRIHAHSNCNSLSSGGSCARPVLPDEFPGAVDLGGGGGQTGGGETGGPASWNRLTIEGSNAQNPTNYQFTVTGELRGFDIDTDHDTVEGQTASGRVANYRDIYEFTGGLASWASSDDSALTVSMNGDVVDPVAIATHTREPNPFDPDASGNYNVEQTDYRGGASSQSESE